MTSQRGHRFMSMLRVGSGWQKRKRGEKAHVNKQSSKDVGKTGARLIKSIRLMQRGWPALHLMGWGWGVLQTFLHTSIHKFNTLGEFGYYQGVLPGIKAEGILSIIHKCAVNFSYCGLFAGITLREQQRQGETQNGIKIIKHT